MIDGIDHVGLAVESIDEARRVFETLGLEVSDVEEVPQEGVRVAMIPIGGTRIELLEPTRSDSTVAKFLRSRGQGMHHLCLATTDIHRDDKQLRDAGVRLLRDEPTRGAEGCRVQFVHPGSAAGVLVELSERSAAGVPEKGQDG